MSPSASEKTPDMEISWLACCLSSLMSAIAEATVGAALTFTVNVSETLSSPSLAVTVIVAVPRLLAVTVSDE